MNEHGIHILNDNSIRKGDGHEGTCPFCKMGKVYYSYLCTHCDICGYCPPGGEFVGSTLKTVRERLDFTRKELGAILGYSHHTVKDSEWKYVSERYYKKFQMFVKRHYGNKRKKRI